MELVKPKMKLNHNYSKLEAVLLRCRERGIALNKMEQVETVDNLSTI